MHECHATHVLWTFETQNSAMAFIFGFSPKKGQGQMKLSPISEQKRACPVQFCLGITKMSFIYTRDKTKSQKLRLISAFITFNLVFGHCTAKNIDTAWIFFPCCFYMSQFLLGESFKILDFIGICFWKIKILIFGDQNNKISKIWNRRFVECFILRLLEAFNAYYFKTVHSSSLQTLACFTQNGKTWRH